MKFAVVTEDGKEIKRCDTERAAERFWDSLNGVWEDDNGEERYIYVEEVAE